MTGLNSIDAARRPSMAKHKWVKSADFHPGGSKGKLHRELGIPEGQKIPASRLAAAVRSDDPEIRADAVRARTMKSWHHGGKSAAARRYSKG
jgi:hypothetical protein